MPKSPARNLLVRRLRESSTRWFGFGIPIRLISGLVAVLFFVGLEYASHLTFGMLAHDPLPAPPGDRLIAGPEFAGLSPRRWVFFLLPLVGGLLSGLVVYRFAPDAVGPGTDAVP